MSSTCARRGAGVRCWRGPPAGWSTRLRARPRGSRAPPMQRCPKRWPPRSRCASSAPTSSWCRRETARDVLITRGLGARVEVVPPGVDIDRFDWEPTAPLDRIPRVLYAGRIGGGRGVRTLLRALQMVRRRRPVKLLLAGASTTALRRCSTRRSPTPSSAATSSGSGAIEHDDMPRVIAQSTRVCRPGRARLRAAAGRRSPPSCSSTWPAAARWWRRAARPCRRSSPTVKTACSSRPATQTDLAAQPRPPARRPELARAARRGRLRSRAACAIPPRPPAAASSRPTRACLPPSQWTPPAPAVTPIDALPSRPDTTTSRRPLPETTLLDGRAAAREVGRDPHRRGPSCADRRRVVTGGLVIEIEAAPPSEDLLRDALEEAVRDEDKDDRSTGKFVALTSPLGFADDAGADEKTRQRQRPLRPKKPSRLRCDPEGG